MSKSMPYPTEPLQTYEWAKKVRLKHLKREKTTQEQGLLLVGGNMNCPKELVAGIGDYVHLAGEPWAVSIIREGGAEMARQCLEAVEKQGYMRDMCAYMRLAWGSLLLDKGPWGHYPKPDLILAFQQCDSMAGWHRLEAEYLNVPLFLIDDSFNGGDGTYKLEEHTVQYLIRQFEDFIDWLVKLTGRPYNDENMVAAMANHYRTRCLWGEILQLQGAVPAPLNYKLILPFYLCLEYYPQDAETVQLLTALRDELKHRVARGIAGTPEERVRVLHEGLAPWYALYLFSYLRERGVAVLGGSHHHCYHPAVQLRSSDGQFGTNAPVVWDGVPRNRAEALRFRAVSHVLMQKWSLDPRVKIMQLRQVLKAWQAQGVIFMMDRGCEMFPIGQLEVKAAMQREGYATVVYETNRVDESEWSWPQVSDLMDSFVEQLGQGKAGSSVKDPGGL